MANLAAINKEIRVNFEKAGKYRIDVKGRLDDRWSEH